MVVRIRVTRVPRFTDFAAGLAGVLSLFAVACFVLSTWKILSDLGWAGGFFIRQGIFSHWLVWAAATVLIQLISFRLARLRTVTD